MQKQQGFTLIELMIVVAIIGILASVAVPQYQSYVARTKVTDSYSTAAAAKTIIADYFNADGVMPDSADAASGSVEVAAIISGATSSAFVSGATWTHTDTAGVLTLTMAGVNANVNTQEIVVNFNGSGATFVVSCVPAAAIDVAYLPKQCK